MMIIFTFTSEGQGKSEEKVEPYLFYIGAPDGTTHFPFSNELHHMMFSGRIHTHTHTHP